MNRLQEDNFNKHYDFALWKKLLKYLWVYKKLVIGIMCVMTGVGLIEATFPMLTRYVIDSFIKKHTVDGIGTFALAYLALVCVQIFNVWALISIAGKIEVNLCHDIRYKGFTHLQELSFSYFDKTPVGWIMSRMTSDIDRIGDRLAWGLTDFIWGLAMMSFITIYMFVLNWKLALLVMVVIPPLVYVSNFFQRRILTAYREVRKTNSKITGAFSEGINGAKTTKTLITEEKNLDQFKNLTGTMYKSSVVAAVLSSIYMPIILTLGSIATAFILWFGGDKVAYGAISYGTLVAFIAYTAQFFEPVKELARVLADMLSAQASAERVLMLIETDPDVIDSDEVIKKYGDIMNPNTENWEEIKGDITFQDVDFQYIDGEKVLEKLNLDIKQGQSVALVGATGSGKSTIVNLVCRFYEPTSGKILIDGIDYKERSQLWLQSRLGYVLQTPHLFSGTIYDNIRYARLDATNEQIEKACYAVNAHEFIMSFEKGYETEVGEGGGRLSTGQKQLLSLARAILKNPSIIVLDEATSSVDTETEQIIQNAMNKLMKGRTSFVVAHRLSTIRSVDRILVIQNGKIIEDGNHKNLLKRRGYYYKLYTNQFLEEEETKALGQI